MDTEDLYVGVERRTPPDRPFIAVNMIASMDGATTIDGRSGGLGGPMDKAVFRALRSAADAVLVGAGTARDESYGPARLSEAQRAARRAQGRTATPRIVVVTRSVKLDTSSAMFTEAEAASPTTVVVPEDADAARVAAVESAGEVIRAGRGGVDLAEAMAQLRTRGIEFVLCEGGPSLNADLARAGLVDEVDLTLAPLIVGGVTRRLFSEPDLDAPLDFDLAHCRSDGSHVFLRYVRSA
jgi:riboflavin-specific deaminase-like protein